MRVFLTGATGFIGSAIILELKAAGHEVLGLARNDENAAKLQAAGVAVHRGDLTETETLAAGAAACDARPGDSAILATTPWGPLGLTICYDLRFPHLHRALAQAGATMIAVPAAFTATTGAAHWEILLRARAIETGAFILAPGQGGLHEDGRTTWGRSMVVDPWGRVIAQAADDEPGVVMAELDLREVAKIRAAVPSLRHDRRLPPVSGT